MKTTKLKEDFPSPMRLLIYLVLVAALCTLNCLTAKANVNPPPHVDNSGYIIRNINLPDVQYTQHHQKIWMDFIRIDAGRKDQ
jgi:hypothetical protein